jgi:PRC-barrel domain
MTISNLKIKTAVGHPQNHSVVRTANVNLVRDLSSLIGSSVVATDGETGSVRDFLFDDRSWRVCNVALDVGNWLRRRDVVLPITVFDFPDWKSKTLQVRLSRAQVRKSPDIDSKKPVSRQQELAMREYFGALACWVETEFGLASFPTGVKYPSPPGENPHLRSAHHLIGYRVRATEGYLGRLDGFLMDKDSWRLGYLEVLVSRALHRRLVAIPTHWVDRVSWAEFRIYLQHQRQTA